MLNFYNFDIIVPRGEYMFIPKINPINNQIEVPKYYNFAFDIVDKRAKYSDKTAMIWIDTDLQTSKKYKFSDLSILSNQFANLLLEQGYKKGDKLFVMIPRVPEWHIIMLGCFKVGVVPMPAPKILQPKDIIYRIKISEAKGAIVYFDSIDRLPDDINLDNKIVVGGKQKGWLSYEDLMNQSDTNLDMSKIEPTLSTDPLVIYFTSGTTKFPKMVMHDQSYALGHYLTAKYWQDLKEDDIHWTLSDTGWGKAVWGKMFGQWIIGTTVVMYNATDPFNPGIHLSILEKFNITTFCAPPTAYRLLIQKDLSKYDFSKLRHSISAGEAINPEVINKWEKYTGTKIHDGYGQTETVNIIANYSDFEVRPGSMGKPVPGFNVDIIDDDCNILPPNEAGHIAIKIKPDYPVGLFKGYYKDEEATKEVFKGDWYLTGDKAYKDEDGYFWFVGRADDVIKSSGYRIGPFEVESALQSHPAVLESAVVASPDAIRGFVVKAFIVLAEGYTASNNLIKDIQEHVREETAAYKYPRKIEFVDSLPKTVSGKIRRVELREKEEKASNSK
jgi:acetyl-CoA synthetase